MSLYLLAVLLVMSSGFPGLFLRRRGGEVAAVLMGLGALIGLTAAIRVLAGGPVATLALPPAPLASPGLLTLDPIAAFFALPVFLLPACAAIYGIGYWDNHQENARTLRLVLGLLAASLAFLVVSTHALPFLLGWEGMAITAFILVMTEDRLPEARRAGWIYLVCTHTGTLALFGVFAILFSASGQWILSGRCPKGSRPRAGARRSLSSACSDSGSRPASCRSISGFPPPMRPRPAMSPP